MTTATRQKERPLISPTIIILAFLTVLGVATGIYRLVMGLGPTTNLSDHYPWGLWIALDVFLIPAAGAAFTISAISHFFNRDDYHEILGPAVLIGLLGYISVALILVLDLGRWHQFYNILIPPYINLHSFLEEVALSVTLYTGVLVLEFAPTLLERWNLDVPKRFIERFILIIAGVGILISTVHQSSIGSMFVILEEALHPIWWTPIIGFLFLIQALFGGLAAAAIVDKLLRDKMGQPVKKKMFITIGKLMRILLVIYVVLKLGDLLIAGELGLLFTSGLYSWLIWGELLLGIVLPLVILFTKLGDRADGVFWASVWTLIGLFICRITVGWVALEAPPWATYYPHWMEIASSVGILAGATLAYIIIARTFDLFPVHEDRALEI